MRTTRIDRDYAVMVADVVASRAHRDQAALIRDITAVLDWVNRLEWVNAVQGLEMTVGDEFQGAYDDIGSALDAELLIRLKLALRYDVRFGIGWGQISSFDAARAPMAQSGSAWWAARDALDRVTKAASKQKWPRSARTLFAGAGEPLTGAINAHLFCRDALLARMDEKDYRILLGLLLGERQLDVSRKLNISQSAVARRQMENGPSAIYQAHLALQRKPQ